MTWRKTLLLKAVFFISFFSAPFYFAGRLLAIIYHRNRTNVGTVYGFDLLGASLGCFALPVLFHFFDLPIVLGIECSVLSLSAIVSVETNRIRRIILALCLFGLGGVAVSVVTFCENSYRIVLGLGDANKEVSQVAHRWNEFSRVTLLKIGAEGQPQRYSIVHDNRLSEVRVRAYNPNASSRPGPLNSLEAPFIMGRKPQQILVMYAGCGAEMTRFSELTRNTAEITGVEINPLVPTLARDTEELTSYRLREFYALSHIDLVIADGRSILQRGDRKFDLIYVGTGSAPLLYLSGSTGKYLDTEQAFKLYLSRLTDGGMLVLHRQRHLVVPMLMYLRRLAAKDPSLNVGESVMLIREPGGWGEDLLISPQRFTKEEAGRLWALSPQEKSLIVYSPHLTSSQTFYAAIIGGQTAEELEPITDDRPFNPFLRTDFDGYSVFPRAQMLQDKRLYHNWLKITTFVLLVSISVIMIALGYLQPFRRLPLPVLLYFLMTGFCFLLIEVAYMAKLELFLMSPLLSMGTVLSTFLLMSGLGSLMCRGILSKIDIRWYTFAVGLVVIVSSAALNYINSNLAGLDAPWRFLIAVLVMAPTAFSLGLFFPYMVSRLTSKGRQECLPMSYCLSTLSSVIGAAYATLAMANLGFTSLLLQAALCYLVLSLLVLFFPRIREALT